MNGKRRGNRRLTAALAATVTNKGGWGMLGFAPADTTILKATKAGHKAADAAVGVIPTLLAHSYGSPVRVKSIERMTENLHADFQLTNDNYYTDRTINLILSRTLEDQINARKVLLLDASESAREELTGKLTEFFQAQLKIAEGGLNVFIPVNLNNTHWTLAVVRKDPDGIIQLIYDDPMGGTLPEAYKAAFRAAVRTAVRKRGRIMEVGYNAQALEEVKVNCGPYVTHHALVLANLLSDNPKAADITRDVLVHSLQESMQAGSSSGVGRCAITDLELRHSHACVLSDVAKAMGDMGPDDGCGALIAAEEYTQQSYQTTIGYINKNNKDGCYEQASKIKNWLTPKARGDDKNIIEHSGKDGKVLATETIEQDGKHSFKIDSGPRVVKMPRLDAQGELIKDAKGRKVCDILIFNDKGCLTGVVMHDLGVSQLSEKWIAAEKKKTVTAGEKCLVAGDLAQQAGTHVGRLQQERVLPRGRSLSA